MTVTRMLRSRKTTCQKTLPKVASQAQRSSWRGESRPASCWTATSSDVTSTETVSSSPTTPIMPSVSARPCRNAREVVFQMRLSARSTTAKTHEPAQSTTTTQVMMTPVPKSESERIVVSRNSPEPG